MVTKAQIMSSLLRIHTRIFTQNDLDHKNLQKNGTKLICYISCICLEYFHKQREPYNKQGLAQKKQRGV